MASAGRRVSIFREGKGGLKMGQPFIGEIRMFGGNFAPSGWAFCNGQSYPISEYDTLYTLIGTTYGGDGVQTFNLPDLRSRVPLHVGNGPFTLQLGQGGGAETVTLSTNQLAGHSHALIASGTPGNVSVATTGSQLSTLGPQDLASTTVYVPYDGTNQVGLNGASISPVGGNVAHDNIQPSAAISFIISLFGIFPSPS